VKIQSVLVFRRRPDRCRPGRLVAGLAGGFVAVLLAVPIAATIQVIVREWWRASEPAVGESGGVVAAGLQRRDVGAVNTAVDMNVRRGDERRRRHWARNSTRVGDLFGLAEAPHRYVHEAARGAFGSFAKSSINSGVLTGPGHSAFTRIFSRANWTASSRLIASTPPLDAGVGDL